MVTNEETIKRLKRRYDHLDRRILEAEAEGRDLTYDKSERTAIGKAIIALEKETEDGFNEVKRVRESNTTKEDEERGDT